MRYNTLGFAAAMCIALGACSDGTGPRTMLVTRIDRAVLDSAGSLNVAFTITNIGTQPEDVPACGRQPGPRVQRQQGKRWEEFAGGLCVAIYSMVPVSLQPGASISGTTDVFAPQLKRDPLASTIGNQETSRTDAVAEPYLERLITIVREARPAKTPGVRLECKHFFSPPVREILASDCDGYGAEGGILHRSTSGVPYA